MAKRRLSILTVAMSLTLAGCSYDVGGLWPSLSDEESVPPPRYSNSASGGTASTNSGASQTATPAYLTPAVRSPAPAPSPMTAPPPALGTGDYRPLTITPGAPTGSFVGKKIVQVRSELKSAQNQIGVHNARLKEIRRQATANSQGYHGTVAAITTRLQIGTTPGNPVLINQWNVAQQGLDSISGDITAMNALATQVAADSGMFAYLLESTRATYGLSGAIDEDHRQLAILEDETNRTVVLVDRLLNELAEDISRQTTYVGNERRNLTTLSLAIKNGELYGSSLSNRAYASSASQASVAPDAGKVNFASANRRPLMVIRFDRADVPYEESLYTAVSRAIDSRPDSRFDLVAVAPAAGSAAKVQLGQSRSRKFAESVLRTLVEMGLPADRVSLSATTNKDVATNEVHIYLR